MDMRRLEERPHPAGVLMKPTPPQHPPVALGSLKLPPFRELASFAVNPYKVDSWPIEPNSRGGRASGDLAIPPLREADEDLFLAKESLVPDEPPDADGEWSEDS